MTGNEPSTMQELGDAMADFSACILAIASALEKKGLLSNEEMRHAAQERLLTLRAQVLHQHPYPLLEMMATKLPSRPDE